MTETPPVVPISEQSHVADYKHVLQRIIDIRPSGLRQRLAQALGKNPSFVSQIVNPIYSTPIPTAHLEKILEVCHASPAERAEFMAAYSRAHPDRRPQIRAANSVRQITIEAPDLGSAKRNRAVDEAIQAFARNLARFANTLK